MLPPQLHLGFAHQEELRVPFIYTEGGFSKPWGGIWTSTFIPGKGSAWLAYRARQDFRPSGQGGLSLWLLTPEDDARVLSINTPEDIERLFDAYSLPFREPRTPGALGLNWPRLALDFDALHVSQEGFEAGYPLLATWSCESTIWFCDRFAQKERLFDLDWMQAFDLSRAQAIFLPHEIELP